MADSKQENKPEVKKFPLFIQVSIEEICNEVPEIRELLFNPFHLTKGKIHEAMNLIAKEFPNKKYEVVQYVAQEFGDSFIFRLKR